MSTAFADDQVLTFRRPSRFATDAATEPAEEFDVVASGSAEAAGRDLSMAEVDISPAQERGVIWRKTLWCVLSHHRNESVHLTRFEAEEEQVGYPAQATATATEVAEAWRGVETEIPAAHREDPAFESSRTELGRQLRELRRRYILGGGQLLGPEEIDREVAERRGEREQENE